MPTEEASHTREQVQSLKPHVMAFDQNRAQRGSPQCNGAGGGHVEALFDVAPGKDFYVVVARSTTTPVIARGW
jgi:hypothetical protein